MDTRINLVNGDVSAYGLACGYRDIKRRTLESGGNIEFRLSFNGATYDVDMCTDDAPEWLTLPNGSRIRAGWAQFERLTDARKFQRRLMSPHVRTTGDVEAHCLSIMCV